MGLNILSAWAGVYTPTLAQNSTYYNPVLKGWNSDPSCIQVNGTFFCVISTFISFPGLPIYASKDLVNWKHISHAWNRESQLPGYSWATTGQQQGMYAATIRIHKGTFYVICEYLGSGQTAGVLFKTTDPFDDKSWSDPVRFVANKIDPDLFWDDDDKVYVATQGIILQEIDINTGKVGTAKELWNGTGGVWPEGPHIYKRDGYYYLLIAEGGTGTDHAVTMARAKSITGPYEPSPHNPHLTNRGTNEYFQTVGHADLFQDTQGKWWGMALATRVGRNPNSYPMGRESVLFPVTWNTGEWPVMQPVRGKMNGWALPVLNRDLPGDGPFNSDPDKYDFAEGKPIPRNLVYWRVPREGAFAVTDKGLQVVLGKNNVGGLPGGSQPAASTISFIGRRQTDTTFKFSVDLTFSPQETMQEAGVTAFLTQNAFVQLGVILNNQQLSFRFNATGQDILSAVPAAWVDKPIRLHIEMFTPNEYTFSAMLVSDEKTKMEVGKAPITLLSGGLGSSFVGTLIGVYATCNGAGSELDCPSNAPKAYFTRWRYTGGRQYYSATEFIPSVGSNGMGWN
ncbi:glycoside hydrolase family 43 protein [Amniculicola lignicola CBS 123094]|uniref:Glycoside hydrolase family 43 protein n=1 Tax=Amniculicola lignicola CBS 123094 TaxID=1392246 RepID=A0A6A5WBN8_9PLEO|nr:glycoside hydrolase family 43 protein [Amniculicola lignicola CBS 123094]